MIRAVIFDLGGTLLNFDGNAQDWRGMEERGIAALYRHLVEQGHPLPEREFSQAIWDAIRRGWAAAMSGHDNACLVSILGAALTRLGLSLDDAAWTRAARIYASGVDEPVVPFDGARELLQQLKERGLRVGLLSNTTWPSEFHLQEIDKFKLTEFFDAMAFSCELGAWKPNAEAFQHVTDRLGVSPAEAVYVGDLPQIDVAGAQRAGLRAVWMAALAREPGEVKPDATIHRLSELPAVLDEWSRD